MPRKPSPLDEIDSELVILHKRREQALDLLVRSFIEMAAIDNRCDVLLDRRYAATAAEALRPMIHR